jgi:hypothetical protein
MIPMATCAQNIILTLPKFLITKYEKNEAKKLTTPSALVASYAEINSEPSLIAVRILLLNIFNASTPVHIIKHIKIKTI